MDLSVIVLTRDEQRHLPRLVASLNGIDVQVYIVDAFSGDGTVEIAKSLGARVFQNPWVNYAAQFEWALLNCNITTPWIMRMDADEYLTPALAEEIKDKLPTLEDSITGITIKRQVHFMGRWIRHGGYYPIKLLRIWRNGCAFIEQRWMDEHIVLSKGRTIEFKHDLVDDNLNNLSWWTEKHNLYATREAVDLLNKEYGFFHMHGMRPGVSASEQGARKRWYKHHLYLRLPLLLRAFLYFNYRYFFQLGFLDGRRGLIWHFLQGFWYRFLVDAKILQIKWYAKREGISIRDAIEQKFNIRIDF